ncbi:quinone oxidoreductase family protein [Nocardiopsis halotolerans]|uniref:quinone oxidoreductase family protein n=1 Tax=Nocardiopsis halotolerans TaxID=124252 RepID=UPI00034DE621|nr:zinc-binding dehydrogenase [Nocardiopsis halotolerans]
MAETATPDPGPGQVLVEAEAISVGYAQTQMRRNAFPAPMWRPSFPMVLGGDVVGRIVALGPDVDGWRVGDRVGAFTLYGAYAEYVAVDEDTLVPVPEGLSPEEAAILPGTGLIAAGVLDTARVVPGESVVVHAAAGGIGHIAVQLARRSGARVVGVVGSSARTDFVRSLGADAVVESGAPDWVDRVRSAAGGAGPDVVLDGVGGPRLLEGVDLLAPLGRLVFYGSSDGDLDIPEVSVMRLIAMKHVTGFALSVWRAARPKAYRRALEDLTRGLADESIVSRVQARFPFEEATKAHALVESRTCNGRAVLIP